MTIVCWRVFCEICSPFSSRSLRRMSIRRRMVQDAMRRWRHLGLGLAAAKERLALTVVDVRRSTFTRALRKRGAVNALRNPLHALAAPELLRVVVGLIPPHRIDDAREATRQGDGCHMTPASDRDTVGPSP